MPLLGLYSWAQFSLPFGIPANNLTGDTSPNDPTSPGYSFWGTSWIDQTFTFNGGEPTQIDLFDDDANFEDGYVETGAAQTLTQALVIDGNYYPVGSVVENEFSLTDASGQEVYVVRINGVNVGFTYANGEGPSPGESFTATSGLDGSPSDNSGSSTSTEAYTNVICFASGTLIDTRAGLKCVETLVRGDLVKTQDAGFQPVIWIGQSAVDLIDRPENLKPVLISAGSLGGGLPHRDLIVSQQHRMLVANIDQTSVDAQSDVFAPAKGLLPLPGVRLMQGKKSVVYVHLLLPFHSVVFSEGVPTESFYPGPTALEMMTDKQRCEILACCPALEQDPLLGYGPLARPSLTVKETKAWAREARECLMSHSQSSPIVGNVNPEPRYQMSHRAY